MKIALCSDIYLPQPSGISDSVDLLARELEQRGHIVRIYAPSMANQETDQNVARFYSFSFGSGGMFRVVLPFGMLRDLKEFAPDVIHTHTCSTLGLVALLASWGLGVPLVGTDHTFRADYLKYIWLDYRPIRYAVKKFTSWYYNRCAIVTTPSKILLDELTEYGMDVSGNVVSNPISTDLFKPLDNTDSAKKKYGITSPTMLFFGRIDVDKNLFFIAEVFEEVLKYAKAELVVVGDGPLLPFFKGILEQKKIDHAVHFFGFLKNTDLVEAVNTGDVYIIASRETQSMTTLQAMACGLPVVVPQNGGLPEYVKDGHTGFVVTPEDKYAFAEKIVLLFKDSEQRKIMGNAGREHVEQFSLGNIADKFEKIYAYQYQYAHMPRKKRKVSVSA